MMSTSVQFTLQFVVFVVYFLASIKGDLEDNEISTNERVIGGTTAPPGAAPYQVSLRDSRKSHFCGGTILGERWILTAAHCLQGTKPAFIVVGTNRLDNGGTMYAINFYMAHPNYVAATFRHDIAMLRTANSIAFNDLVKPINLPTSDISTGVSLLLTGWGMSSYPGNPATNQLQYIRLMTVDMSKCANIMRPMNTIYETQICTFNMAGQGACHGDSGGPLVDRNAVVGVVSWGYPCAKGYPDIFTRVFNYVNWIKSIAAQVS